jgi:hypothetical protein
MLYDNYRNKILQRAQAIRKAIYVSPVIAAVFAIILALLITIAVAVGTVTSISFANNASYGESAPHKATAFLSKAHFEYSPKGEDNWSAETPALPGSYDARVVSKGFFGKHYKYVDVFHIYPRRIDIRIQGGSISYGENPAVNAIGLAEGDRIECGEFIYESQILAQDTSAELLPTMMSKAPGS